MVIAIGSVAASSTSAVAEDLDPSSQTSAPVDVGERAADSVVNPIVLPFEVPEGQIVIRIPLDVDLSTLSQVSSQTEPPSCLYQYRAELGLIVFMFFIVWLWIASLNPALSGATWSHPN